MLLITFHHQHRDDYQPPRESGGQIWTERIILMIGAAIFLAMLWLFS